MVVTTFFVLWLALLAASVYIPFSTKEPALGPAVDCTSVAITESELVALAQLVTLMYDTMVFVTISWRLGQIAYVRPSGTQESLKLLFFGKYLPAFAKSLYLDGQVYYL